MMVLLTYDCIIVENVSVLFLVALLIPITAMIKADIAETVIKIYILKTQKLKFS